MNQLESDVPVLMLITYLRQKHTLYIIGNQLPSKFLPSLPLEVIRICQVFKRCIWVDFIQSVLDIRMDWYVNVI